MNDDIPLIGSADEALSMAGRHIGRTDWLTVTQDRIDAFAAATGDQQWIHVDRLRAASGPFGGGCVADFTVLYGSIPAVQAA